MELPHFVRGDGVAAKGVLRLGCAAAVFDESGERILLLRRADDSAWCLPWGDATPGESLAETCERRTRETCGLMVRVRRIIGVYSDPNVLLVMPGGPDLHLVEVCFEAETVSGKPGLTEHISEARFVTLEESKSLNVADVHIPAIEDAFVRRAEAFIR
jgi:ADP-ribose pyrophosphatase YjhB (NUDIX family)